MPFPRETSFEQIIEQVKRVVKLKCSRGVVEVSHLLTTNVERLFVQIVEIFYWSFIFPVQSSFLFKTNTFLLI